MIQWMRKGVESGSWECQQNDVTSCQWEGISEGISSILWNTMKWEKRVKGESVNWILSMGTCVSLEYSGKKWKKCGSGRLSVNIILINVKVLKNKVDRWVRTGVEMVPRDYSGTQWKEKWKGKLGVSTYCCKWEVIWWLQCCRIQWNEKKE